MLIGSCCFQIFQVEYNSLFSSNMRKYCLFGTFNAMLHWHTSEELLVYLRQDIYTECTMVYIAHKLKCGQDIVGEHKLFQPSITESFFHITQRK